MFTPSENHQLVTSYLEIKKVLTEICLFDYVPFVGHLYILVDHSNYGEYLSVVYSRFTLEDANLLICEDAYEYLV